MFESNVLDRLSRVHPAVPVIIFAPAIVALCAWSLSRVSVGTTALLMVAGYALRTLLEYWLHRIVFHFEPENGLGARLHWIIHGVHHDHPNDPLRLVMPPSVSLPLAVLFIALFYVVFGRRLSPGIDAGFVSGYLAYDMIHFYVHHGRPTSRVAKLLREQHMRHHFQDDRRGFGVSAPYWDRVFGTATRSRRAGANTETASTAASARPQAPLHSRTPSSRV